MTHFLDTAPDSSRPRDIAGGDTLQTLPADLEPVCLPEQKVALHMKSLDEWIKHSRMSMISLHNVGEAISDGQRPSRNASQLA